MKELFELGDPRVDPDDLRRSLGEQVVAEPAPPVHLDEQTAEIAEHVLASGQERAPLATEDARVGASRSDSLVRSAPAEKTGHPGESNEGITRYS